MSAHDRFDRTARAVLICLTVALAGSGVATFVAATGGPTPPGWAGVALAAIGLAVAVTFIIRDIRQHRRTR